jgi:hypothetical protein
MLWQPDHTTVTKAARKRVLLAGGQLGSYAFRRGEHIAQRSFGRPRDIRNQPEKQTADALGRRLLEIIVYRQNCRAGGKLTLDNLEATEIGDWTMPEFKTACAYSAAQGWLIVQGNLLTLTTTGLAAA